MDNLFISSGIIAIVYLLFKFLEMRFIKNESLPIKELVKDGLIIYLCSCIGLYLVSQFIPIAKTLGTSSTKVFTDGGNF